MKECETLFHSLSFVLYVSLFWDIFVCLPATTYDYVIMLWLWYIVEVVEAEVVYEVWMRVKEFGIKVAVLLAPNLRRRGSIVK